jgi:hypothetical protein
MDVATITAWGTMITGWAAIIAVFGGFYTMRSQVQKTAMTAWIQSFRSEAANFLNAAENVPANGGSVEAKVLFHSLTLFRLYLSTDKPAQKKLIEELQNFVPFLMNLSELNQRQFSAEFPKYYRKIVDLSESVIKEAEGRL